MGGTVRQTGRALAVVIITAAAITIVASPKPAQTHCQMPCGIYDDPARVQALREDVTTIEKAVTTIAELAGKSDAQSINQATRWVSVKEETASHMITTMADYFLTQRVKPVAAGEKGYEDYLKSLADHHAVMVAAMKVKQNADPKFVTALKDAVEGMAKYYDLAAH